MSRRPPLLCFAAMVIDARSGGCLLRVFFVSSLPQTLFKNMIALLLLLLLLLLWQQKHLTCRVTHVPGKLGQHSSGSCHPCPLMCSQSRVQQSDASVCVPVRVRCRAAE